MNRSKTIKVALVVAVATIVGPIAAFAAEHGAEHVPSIGDLKFFWLNFLVYSFGLYFITRNPIKSGWLARRAAIAEAVSAAKRETDAAHAELSAAQTKMQSLSADISKMTADLERETQRESADIVAQAKIRAERITQQSKELAEAERKSTEALIRRELVNAAIDRARERLQKEVNAQTDKPLRETALGAVQQLIQ